MFELLEFFDDNDDRLAKLAPQKCDTNEGRVFVTIANDQAFRVLVHRQRGDQFWFAARFQPEMKLLAGVDYLLDDLSQLVHLDRKNASIGAAITELGNRRLESAIHRLDAVPQ